MGSVAKHFAACNDREHEGGAHVEPAKNWKELVKYCTKEETRHEGPWTLPEEFKTKEKEAIAELRPWQVSLKEILMEEPDDRTIHWIYDEGGNSGKSVFTRWVLTRTPAKAIAITGGAQKDLAYAIVKYIEVEEEDPTVLLLDCPRASEGRVSYRFLEEIKNGMFTSVKYESTTVTLHKEVHVVVFANSMPDLAKMSSDRWKVYTITAAGELAHQAAAGGGGGMFEAFAVDI